MRRTVIAFLLALSFIFGAYQFGLNRGLQEGISQGRIEGKIKACDIALHGFANLMAGFGMYLRGTAACHMDGDDVVFDQIFGPTEKATFNLDLTPRK